ncbi:sulfate/molybdate ABC transporter ATP-binding protein [Neisseria lisongii]|uniref:ATP-binding cassette domain-containing protein n=1 Tax=Neisseria lisongii TaxID=2912188 RepID=A0AAW5AFJ5_9NEIS|nr:ATP-binding cassette domain-containing protein [Neisseria lisongii]MCF7528882.1 ATP-binding cassette domain-containing protein [Neisseria lisongii]
MRFDIVLQKKLGAFGLNVRLQSDAARLAVVGRSGSGKSLLLQLLAGLLQPDGGHIRFNGETWFDAQTDVAARRRRVGLLFQNYALFPHLTVAQNIDFGCVQSWRNPAKRPSEKAQHWLSLLQLEAVAHLYPHQISGGQQQRTALARTLIVEPQLLLLDEPFSALDADLRQAMRAEVLQIQQRSGVPMMVVTHDAEDAAVLAEEVWQMENGVLHKTGFVPL